MVQAGIVKLDVLPPLLLKDAPAVKLKSCCEKYCIVTVKAGTPGKGFFALLEEAEVVGIAVGAPLILTLVLPLVVGMDAENRMTVLIIGLAVEYGFTAQFTTDSGMYPESLCFIDRHPKRPSGPRVIFG